ncbi:MAG: hypothetical protein MUF78_04945 [Candidatus Edwardsbacteria bacterium]|jgi:hypothetical protein|nr:hypothetical protein [Candidatus Edwardsbacteria bacterium]
MMSRPVTDIVALLAEAAEQSATGVLVLRGNGDQARIGLRRGSVVSADHGDDRPAPLQRYLYRMGLIDGIKHDVVSRMRAEYGLSFEEAVIKSSVIEASRLAAVVAFKITEVLTDIMTCGALGHEFEPGSSLYPSSRVAVALDARGLSRELRCRQDAWRSAERFLGGGGRRVCAAGTQPVHPLERDQSVVYRLASDGAALQDLAAGSGLGRYRTYRSAYQLVQAGLLELVPA